MRYNNLLCPLITLYGKLWNQSVFYVSYMTLYDFQEIFSTSKENENYTIFRLLIFFYDPCMISRKSYMILVWLLRNHTNHIWPCMNTRNHIWRSMTTRNFVWWATRATAQQIIALYSSQYLSIIERGEIKRMLNIHPKFCIEFGSKINQRTINQQMKEKTSSIACTRLHLIVVHRSIEHVWSTSWQEINSQRFDVRHGINIDRAVG